MPGLAVAPNPVANAAVNNVAANNGNVNGSGGANDTANGDTSFSSALQRSMKSNSSDKPANNDTKSSGASTTETPAQTAAAAASETHAADPLATLLPMLQGKFSQVAQTMEQSGDNKDKSKNTATDDESSTGQDALMASLAGTLGAQQQQSQLPTKTDAQLETKVDPNAKGGASVAAEAAILASADGVNGQAKRAGEKEGGDANFQALLDSAHNAQQAQHNQEVRMAQPANHAETRIETPVGHERWTQEVGDKLSWMVTKQESSATLVLNPPHMGRVEVSVTINGDQASASFVSANPAVREALENAIPRLKEVLADAGVQLGQAQVGAESRGDSSQNPERRDNRGHNNTVTGELVPGIAGASPTTAGSILQGNGMVDTFV